MKTQLLLTCLTSFLLSWPLSWPAASAEELGKKIFRRAKKAVVTVKLAQSAQAPKSSYGSGYFIDAQGHVVTNFHVIAPILQQEGQKIYVVKQGQVVPAALKAADVLRDLAILKIKGPSPSFLSLSDKLPAKGEKVFSLGMPKDLDLSIVEGTFNGLFDNGTFNRLHLSSAINAGMSGGPTLNRQGELIGTNVSIFLFSNNVSFAVPAHILRALKKRAETAQELSRQTLLAQLEKQMISGQQTLMEQFLQLPERTKKFKGWRVPTAPDHFRCWQYFEKYQSEQKYRIEHNVCRPFSATPVRDGLTSPYFTVQSTRIENRGLNGFQLYALAHRKNQQPASILNPILDKGVVGTLLTPFSCDYLFLANTKKTPLKVQYCLQGWVQMPTLHNAVIQATTLNGSEEILIVKLHLFSFTLKNIQRFLVKGLKDVRAL